MLCKENESRKDSPVYSFHSIMDGIQPSQLDILIVLYCVTKIERRGAWLFEIFLSSKIYHRIIDYEIDVKVKN